ncbi:hypothetical protein FB451DRAFT_1170389 [Mycena latifolia]|nr:hypothetical protein FB451DRAFT_1170389 [Mycena latifolia]
MRDCAGSCAVCTVAASDTNGMFELSTAENKGSLVHRHPAVASSSQGPADALYSDLSLAGWAGPTSPLPRHIESTHQFSAQAHNHHQIPPFTSAPTMNIMNHEYMSPVYQAPLTHRSSVKAPAPGYPQASGDLGVRNPAAASLVFGTTSIGRRATVLYGISGNSAEFEKLQTCVIL